MSSPAGPAPYDHSGTQVLQHLLLCHPEGMVPLCRVRVQLQIAPGVVAGGGKGRTDQRHRAAFEDNTEAARTPLGPLSHMARLAPAALGKVFTEEGTPGVTPGVLVPSLSCLKQRLRA